MKEIEELLKHVQKLKSKGQEIDTNGLEDWLISVGVPKTKEQFKQAVIKTYKDVIISFEGKVDHIDEGEAKEYFKREYGY